MNKAELIIHLLTNYNHDFHNRDNTDILTQKALQFILSKLWQVVVLSKKNTARQMVYGVEKY